MKDRVYREVAKSAKTIGAFLPIILGAWMLATGQPGEALSVSVRPLPEKSRVQIWLGEKLLTEYRYGPEYPDKPVFYPVLTRKGQAINRNIPTGSEEAGDNHDHPHQKSLFFAYGDVNGIDFWTGRNGRIAHHEVMGTRDGERGELTLELRWLGKDDQPLLRETRRVTFGGTESVAWIDHDSQLEAVSESVVFGDTKEGMFALRLTPELQEEGGTGTYVDAHGRRTEPEIWGKRAPWVALRGELKGDPLTIAIFDHPSTQHHPSYWHARAYGLFAANPLGRKDFVEGSEAINPRLAPGESFRFRYRLMVYEEKIEKAQLDADYAQYIQ